MHVHIRSYIVNYYTYIVMYVYSYIATWLECLHTICISYLYIGTYKVFCRPMKVIIIFKSIYSHNGFNLNDTMGNGCN